MVLDLWVIFNCGYGDGYGSAVRRKKKKECMVLLLGDVLRDLGETCMALTDRACCTTVQRGTGCTEACFVFLAGGWDGMRWMKEQGSHGLRLGVV